MDQASRERKRKRNEEKWQPRATKDEIALLERLKASRSDPKAVLSKALATLERETSFNFHISSTEQRSLQTYLGRFSENAVDYLYWKATPDAVESFQNNILRWIKTLKGLSDEMQHEGCDDSLAILSQLRFNLLQKLPSQKTHGYFDLVPANEVIAAKDLLEFANLALKYRRSRAKSSEDYFTKNFLIPADKLLGKKRNKYFFLAVIYLHFYPERATDYKGKLGLKFTANTLYERVSANKKQKSKYRR